MDEYTQSLAHELSQFVASYRPLIVVQGYREEKIEESLKSVQISAEVCEIQIEFTFRPELSFSEQFERLDRRIQEDIEFMQSFPESEEPKPIAYLRAQTLLSSEDGEWDANRYVLGSFIEQGDTAIAHTVVELIWDANFLERDQALECLAIFGRTYFQDLIDENVGKALDSDDEGRVFAAVASYHDMTKQAQQECRPKLEALCQHANADIKRAAECALRTT